MFKKTGLLFTALVLFLSFTFNLSCSGGGETAEYTEEEVAVMLEFQSIIDNFISALENAETPGDLSEAMGNVTVSISEITPEFNKLTEQYKRDTSEKKEISEEVKTYIGSIKKSFEKVDQLSNSQKIIELRSDPEVIESLKKFRQVWRELKL